MKSKIAIIILLVLVVLEAILILYFAGVLNRFIRSPRLLKALPPLSNSLVNFVPTTIQGKITRVSGNIISIKESSGNTGELAMAENVKITPPPKDNQIVLNKDVLITLVKKDEGNYIVDSILYVPDNFQVPIETKPAPTPSISTATPAALPSIVSPPVIRPSMSPQSSSVQPK